MTFGFDLDGTLDRPELARLATHLYETGHTIHVITVGTLGSYRDTRENKAVKLAKLGVKYTFLHLVHGGSYSECGARKAGLVNKLGIEVMFDDSSTFCEVMAGLTKAVILRVKEPNDEEQRTG